jgi:hypothetical protein
MATFLLFALMLLVMLTRVYVPLGAKIDGKVESSVTLSLFERAQLQRVNIYAIGVVLLLTVVTGVMPPAGEILVVVIALGILMMPVRCVFTSRGVAFNNVLFRPWSDFASFERSQRRLSLIGRDGTRPMRLTLLREHQTQALPVLRRHLPEAKASRSVDGQVREASIR